MLDSHLSDMEIHDKNDGSITLCRGITEIEIENLRRRLWKEFLKTVATEG